MLKVWNGSSWASATLKVFDGSWQEKTLRIWNGAEWSPSGVTAYTRGLFRWDWSASVLANTGGAQDTFVSFLTTYGFNEIYLYAYDVHLTGTTNANNFSAFILRCHNLGIKVWGIFNQGNVSPSDLPDPAKDQNLIVSYLNYQKNHANKFDGLMFDIETLTNIIDSLNDYMDVVLTYAYSGETLVTQGWPLGIYLDPPYYLTNPRDGDYAGCKSAYAYFDKILLNTYRTTAADTVATVRDGAQACSELGIEFMVGLESLPGWENSFTGTSVGAEDIPVYYSFLNYIDNATESNFLPYKASYTGTYLDAWQYVKDWGA